MNNTATQPDSDFTETELEIIDYLISTSLIQQAQAEQQHDNTSNQA